MAHEWNSLELLLKKKGIGPEGSKHLSASDLDQLKEILNQKTYSITTLATLLTALILLDKTLEEKNFLEGLPLSTLPEEVHFLFTQSSSNPLGQYTIQTLLKKSLSYVEAREAMTLLLHSDTPDYIKATFLEAQRLKRETSDENRAFFDVLYENCNRLTLPLPLLIDIGDSYDGYDRHYNVSIFLAATLASIGYPTIVHGVNSVAPKFGHTSHEVLQALHLSVSYSLSICQQKIMDSSVGWAYMDQSVFFPSLYALRTMRKEMVKRPFLATFEKLLQPLQSNTGNILFSGYTHPHYKQEVVQQVARQNQAAQALISKGLEGSGQLPLQRTTTLMHWDGQVISEHICDPSVVAFSFEQKPGKHTQAADAAILGLDALKGNKNEAYYSIVYTGSTLLHYGLSIPMEKAKQTVEESILSGKALQHLLAF